MEVLSSRVLLSPVDFERSRRWYAEALGLRVYREFGVDGRVTGVVFFLGGGFLELSSAGTHAPLTLWLQVPDVDAEHERLAASAEVTITSPPETMPWGLREMWIDDPDGVHIAIVEVPENHPIRRRVD